jgi:hypothetical protein
MASTISHIDIVKTLSSKIYTFPDFHSIHTHACHTIHSLALLFLHLKGKSNVSIDHWGTWTSLYGNTVTKRSLPSTWWKNIDNWQTSRQSIQLLPNLIENRSSKIKEVKWWGKAAKERNDDMMTKNRRWRNGVDGNWDNTKHHRFWFGKIKKEINWEI